MVVGRSTSGGIVVVGAEGRHRGPSPSSSPPTSRIGRADAAVPATAGEPRSAAAAAAAPRLGDTPPTPPTLAGIAETPTPEVAAGEGGGRAGPDGDPGQATVHGRKQAPSSKASKQPAPPLDPQLLELSGQLGGLSAGADVAGMASEERALLAAAASVSPHARLAVNRLRSKDSPPCPPCCGSRACLPSPRHQSSRLRQQRAACAHAGTSSAVRKRHAAQRRRSPGGPTAYPDTWVCCRAAVSPLRASTVLSPHLAHAGIAEPSSILPLYKQRETVEPYSTLSFSC